MPTTQESRFTMPADPLEMLRLLSGEGQQPTVNGGNGHGDAAARGGVGKAPSPNGGNGHRTPPQAATATEQAPPQAATATARESNGRFAKGNFGGPGNPFNRQVAAFRKQFLAATTPEMFQMAHDALMAKVKTGDVAALKLFFQYTMGTPQEAKDPDRVDLDEVELIRESKSAAKDWRDLTGQPYLDTMLVLVRTVQNLVNQQFCQTLGNNMRAVDQREAEQTQVKEEAKAKRRERRVASKAAAKRPQAAAAKRSAPTANVDNGLVAAAASGGAKATPTANGRKHRVAATGSDDVPKAPSANGGNGRR